MHEAVQQPIRSEPAEGINGSLPWAAAGTVVYLLAGIAAVLITALVADPFLEAGGIPVQAGAVGLSARNALQPLVWGALVAVVSAPLGRRLVGAIRFSIEGWLVLAVGLALSAATAFLVQEFVRARFEVFDPEYVGFSILTWPALVAVALSGWAALAVPRRSTMPLLVLLALAALGLAVALLPSVVGAADGIDAGNIPLASTFVLDVAYTIGVVVVAVMRPALSPPA